MSILELDDILITDSQMIVMIICNDNGKLSILYGTKSWIMERENGGMAGS